MRSDQVTDQQPYSILYQQEIQEAILDLNKNGYLCKVIYG